MEWDRGYVGQDISEKDSLNPWSSPPAQPTEKKTSQGFVELGCPDISATHRWLSKYCVTQTQLSGKFFFFSMSEIISKYENDLGVNRQTCEHFIMDSCIFFGIIKLEITQSSGNQDPLSTRMISQAFKSILSRCKTPQVTRSFTGGNREVPWPNNWTRNAMFILVISEVFSEG